MLRTRNVCGNKQAPSSYSSVYRSWNEQTDQIHMGLTNCSPAKIYTYELTPYLHLDQMSLLLKFYKATQQQGERWRDYWIIDKNIFTQLRCIHVSEKAPGKSPRKGTGWIPAKATWPPVSHKGWGAGGSPREVAGQSPEQGCRGGHGGTRSSPSPGHWAPAWGWGAGPTGRAVGSWRTGPAGASLGQGQRWNEWNEVLGCRQGGQPGLGVPSGPWHCSAEVQNY